MESNASTTLLISPPTPISSLDVLNKDNENGVLAFESNNLLQKQTNLPNQFVWPHGDLVETNIKAEELKEPLIDLQGFIRGDEEATSHAAELVRIACLNHGFFQVTNHGVPQELIEAAYNENNSIFNIPFNKKLSVRRKPGSVSGYSGAHADRYSSKLPWKETFSFCFQETHYPVVVDYFQSVLGQEFQHTG